ncbi:hypothetical protein DERP_014756 [Dermatophagoides pteronyssinus]|uniref:Uncharacterized protein n=1 Tax=Dermatophagoides pteronyssinus TaxID=6956 RepID=A0ABQ8JCB1_DERPT|nr:hypothetical protein DERP_014756 [Dermatophagoides pteronyssinus]
MIVEFDAERLSSMDIVNGRLMRTSSRPLISVSIFLILNNLMLDQRVWLNYKDTNVHAGLYPKADMQILKPEFDLVVIHNPKIFAIDQYLNRKSDNYMIVDDDYNSTRPLSLTSNNSIYEENQKLLQLDGIMIAFHDPIIEQILHKFPMLQLNIVTNQYKVKDYIHFVRFDLVDQMSLNNQLYDQ